MKRGRINSSKGQTGVSLIELMIAMILGLLVLGAVIQLVHWIKGNLHLERSTRPRAGKRAIQSWNF